MFAAEAGLQVGIVMKKHMYEITINALPVRHTSSNLNAEFTSYKLELLHPDRKRCLGLYQSRNPDGLRERRQNYCRQLHLPALEGEDKNDLTVCELD